MTKLEKFKRRLIRSVATLLIVEKKPEDELWDILREEIGRNCKVLWERMRALTVKKLKRLLAAEDNISLIPKFARMSETDWLFFDLIIAHEDEDVIGREEWYEKGLNTKVLTDLFALVQRFNIEDMQKAGLAEAWTAATIFYNSSGHRCSPMLMQRRWYQLKQCTRQRFYQFWFSYRGSLRYWDEVKNMKPNELQQAIANRFPHIITAPFPPWEELINSRLIVLPQEFEKCKNKTDLLKPCDENAPDLLLLEPVIETIDLEEYISDEEKSEKEISKGLSKDEESMVSKKIKIEPEDVYDNSELEEERCSKTHISIEVMSSLEQEETLLNMNDDVEGIETKEMYQENAKNTNENEAPESDIINEGNNVSQTAITKPIQEDVPIVVKDTTSEIISVSTTDSLQENISKVTNEGFHQNIPENISESFEEGIPKITNVFGNVDITNEDLINSLTQRTKNLVEKSDLTIMPISGNENDCETINLDDNSDTDDVHIKEESSAPSKDNSEEVGVKNPSHSPIKDSISLKTSNDNHENEETMKTKQSLFGGLRNYFDFTEEGIELVDDGIEYVEDDELEERTDCHIPNKIESGDNEDPCDSDEAKFDLKLLMQTTVFTTKLDDMKVLKDKSFHSVESQSLIDSIMVESKPACSKSLYIPNCMNTDNSINDDNNAVDDAKRVENSINDDILIGDDHNELDDSERGENSINADSLIDDDHNEVDDAERVEMSSNLLKKPRNRIYNPIKLCKNPDFNTRLKRLTVGFLSSSRNRFLLKICKPMTIDMSKAFESKLVNGTMYLKNSNTTIETLNDGNDNKTASVVPSAISVQSLIDNMIVRTLPAGLKSNEQPQLVCSFDGSVAERNKIVSLPDKNKVRVINQQLLTAEVTPFRIQNCILKNVNQTENITKENNITTPVVPLEKNVGNYNVIDLDSQPLTSDNHVQILNDTPVEYKAEDLINTSDLVINDKETEEESVPFISNNSKQFYTDKPNFIQSGSSNSKIYKRKNYNSSFLIKQGPWRCEPRKAKVSWLENVKYRQDNDALITIDTLYKMLSHINGSSNVTAPIKNKLESKKDQKGKKLKKVEDKSKETVTPVDQEDTLTSDTEPIINNLKPKITVVFAKHDNDYKSLDCCWARTRINQKKSEVKKNIFKHTCKRNQCTCCCKNELKDLLTRIGAEIALKSACDSIESVVQQTRELIAVQATDAVKSVTETVAVQTHIDLSDDPSDNEMADTIKSKQVISTDCSDSNKASSIDVIGKKFEDIRTEDENTCITLETNEVKRVPDIGVDNLLLSKCAPVTNSKCIDHVEVVQSVQNIEISASKTVPFRNDTSKLSKQRISICAKNYTQKSTDSSCQQLNNQFNDKMNSDVKIIKQYNIEKNSKERVLILNRRHLSKSRAENPIYLGKNKILVTNVKIPSHKITNKQTQKTLDGLQFASIIPKGVQLMLSPTGELLCNLLPGAEIDTNSLSELPSIMAAVQTQLNLTSGSLPSHDAFPKISMSQTNSEEVFDLCENESEPSRKGNLESYQFVSPIKEGTVISNNETNIDYDTSSQRVIELEQTKRSSEEQLLKISTNTKQSILKDALENTGENDDTNSLSELPSIMAPVQTQLNLTSGLLLSHDAFPKICMSQTNSDEVLDLCENESEPYKKGNKESFQFVSSFKEGTVISNNEANIDHDSSSQQVIELEQTKRSSEEQLLEISTNKKQIILEDAIENTDENEIASASQIKTVLSESVHQLPTKDEYTLNEPSKTKQETMRTTENSEENATKTTLNDVSSTNRKTLLSDLMEMSGISTEDVAPTESIIPPEIVELPSLIPLSSQHMLSTVDSPASNVPISVNSSIQNNILHELRVPLTDPEDKSQTSSLPQLNTITSYSELKYACENKGSFFKLDYKTGTIVPITVCIKKKRTFDINSESVIDLTEEKDDTSEDPKDGIQPNESPKRHLILKTLKVKPLKVFRAIRRPNILQKQKMLIPKAKIMKRQSNSLLKPNVNIVNSDILTEKTCVINSSDDESPQHKRKYSSDSSDDDEPLISIAKRKKIETENKNNENAMDLVEMKEKTDKTGKPSTDVVPAVMEFLKEFSENDMMNDDSELSPGLSIILDHTDVDEDCILGV